MFMHEGWLHIGGNMIFLWAFGPQIEDTMGRFRYLVFYLLCGLAATLGQVAVMPASTIPNLGASGAIAGVMGAFIVTYPRDRIRTILFLFVFATVTVIPAGLLIGIWFLMQLFSGVGSVAKRSRRRSRLHGPRRRLHLRRSRRPPLRAPRTHRRRRTILITGDHVPSPRPTPQRRHSERSGGLPFPVPLPRAKVPGKGSFRGKQERPPRSEESLSVLPFGWLAEPCGRECALSCKIARPKTAVCKSAYFEEKCPSLTQA